MKQRGSVIGYVLVGILLTTLLIGGVFVVKNNWREVNQDTAVTSGDKSQDNSSSSSNSEQSDKTENDKLIDNIKDNEAKKEKDATTTVSPRDQSKSTPPTSSEAADSLPQTGPEDAVSTIIALGSLVGTGLAYARSRSSL